jgi:hypothetical protein
MAVITNEIWPEETSTEVTEMQKALISLGAYIAPEELFTATTEGNYGFSTQNARGALILRFGLVELNPRDRGQPVLFTAVAGRLLNIAVGAEAGNSAALQEAVRESFDAGQADPAADLRELVLLARYAIIARDFSTARSIVEMIPDSAEPRHLEEREKIASIVGLSTLQPPESELRHPENYLTVAHKKVPPSMIDSLMQSP